MMPDELLRMLRTNGATGLSRQEASKRLRRFGLNKIWVIDSRPRRDSLIRLSLDLCTVLFLISAAISAIFRVNGTGAWCFILAVIGIALRLLAYYIASRSFITAAKASFPAARVIRDGRGYIIPADSLTVGDVILLEAGDTVPCDARILDCAKCAVSEKGITENKNAVIKGTHLQGCTDLRAVPCEMRANMLYAGSTVLEGSCRAVCVTVGTGTLTVAKNGVTTVHAPASPLFAKLERHGRIASAVSLLFTVIITVIALISGGTQTTAEIFLSATALAASSVWSFLPAFEILSYAVTFRRLYSNIDGSVIIRNPAAVARLAKTSTVALKSTQSLIADEVNITYVRCADEEIDLYSDKNAKISKLCLDARTACNITGALISDRSQRADGTVQLIERATEMFCIAGTTPAAVDSKRPTDDMSGGVYTAITGQGTSCRVISCGDAARILTFCTEYRAGGDVHPISAQYRRDITEKAHALVDRGDVVIAVATRNSPYNSLNRISALHMNMTFEGFFSIGHKLKKNTLQNLEMMRTSGMRLIIFTDGSRTDACFALESGIVRDGDRFTSCADALKSGSFTLSPGTFALVKASNDIDGIRERRIFLTMVKESYPDLVYVGNSGADLWSLKDAPTSAAIPATGDTLSTIPHTIRRISDMLIIPTAISGAPSLLADARRHCAASMLALRRVILYLSASAVSRALIMLMSVLAGCSVMSPVELLLTGSILDLAAAIIICVQNPPQDYASSDPAKCALPRLADYILPSVGALLIAASSFIAPLILLPRLAPEADGARLVSMIFVSLSLALPALCIELIADNVTIIKAMSKNRLLVVFPAVMLSLSAIVCLLSMFNSFTDAAGWTKFALWGICHIPLVLTVAFFEIYRAVTHTSADIKQKPDKI